MKRKYLIYKVTNRFDGKIYIGCHSTLNKNDRYMGSGTEIKEALKEFGKKSFVKEILFEYDTKEEMLAKEKEIVTKEFCMRENTYNRIEGGGVYVTEGMVSVKDKNGNISIVYTNDPRYISGELVHVTKGTVTVKDNNGIFLRVLPDDERLKSGELKMSGNNLIAVKDKNGNSFSVSIEDPRWLSGELVGVSKGLKINNKWTGKHHKQESKEAIGKANSIKQTGSDNSQYGTMWITKESENKKIKKEDFDVYLQQGWIKGRKILKFEQR